MKRSRKAKAGMAVVVIVIAAAALLMTNKKKERGGPGGMMEETPVTVVKASKPEIGSISRTTSLTGTVEPSDVVTVYAKAGGDVTAVHVAAGDMVTQGQVLFEIDTEQVDSAKNSMDAAAVSLSEAQSNLSRMQILYQGGDLSDQDYEQYTNAVKSAKLQYESAKLQYEKQVEYSTVTAPISGKVENCDVEVYDRISQSQDLCVIAGEGENRISFYVTQRMMKNLKTGDQAEVQKNGTSYEAYISEISSMVDSGTGLFKVKAQIKEDGEIAAGSTVKLNLVTERADSVLLVPIDAVYYSNGNAYVYLYQDEKAVKTEVEIGLEDSEHAEILSGLTGEEMVVSTWSNNLYEGAKIRLKDESQEEGGQDTASQSGQPETVQLEKEPLQTGQEE